MIMCRLKVACINGKGQITCYTDNVRSRIKPKPLLFSLAVHWWGETDYTKYAIFYGVDAGTSRSRKGRRKEETREPIPHYTLLQSHKAVSGTDPEI